MGQDEDLLKRRNMLKVLQIHKLYYGSYYPESGGIEKTVKDIAEGLKDKIEMEVLVCRPKGKGVTLSINGIRVTKASSLGMYTGMPVSITFPFLFALKSRKADILHFHLPFPLGDISYLLMGARGKKVVVTYHSDIVRQKRLLKLYKPFLHQFLRRADKIIVTSPYLLESSEHLAPYRDKCVVIPLSIDLNKFKPCNEDKANYKKMNPSSNEKIVLFVGCLTYYTGLSYLVRAMQDVKAKLLIVGDGELRGQLEAQVKSLGLDDKVIFLGAVSDEKLHYYYQICDVFVLPSTERSEAFGIVQLEAMAYGKPVVNTNLPTAVPFISVHGETGLTVPPKNPDALAQAINTILSDKQLSAKFSRNAIKRVKEKFSRDVMLEKIYQIYTELCSN